MRALTLTQPWAGIVASGVKLVENRPRSMIKREDFGKPFAIHASKVIDAAVYDLIHRTAPEIGRGDVHVSHAPPWGRLSRITSAVIAVAEIEGIATNVSELADIWHHTPNNIGWQKRWFFGPIGYALCHVIALKTPVPCRGRQGFWTLYDDDARKVVEQLR